MLRRSNTVTDIPDNTYYDSLTGTEYDYAYVTASQSNMNGRGLSWPRGKVLGGSSAINGMYHVRPAKVEVEAWQSLIAAEGDSDAADNWSWDSFFAAMKKSETFTAPSDDAESVAGITYDASLHGTDGPIHVSYPGLCVSKASLRSHRLLLTLHFKPTWS